MLITISYIFKSLLFIQRLTRFVFKMYSNYTINLKIYYNYVLIMVVILDYDIVYYNLKKYYFMFCCRHFNIFNNNNGYTRYVIKVC